MTDFDKKLHDLLSVDDAAFVTDAIDDNGYYKEVVASLKGHGSGIRVLSWIGVLVVCTLLFFVIWKFSQATTTRDQILFASLAIMLNSAQIGLKMWFNLQLNRRAIIRELKRLQLAVMHRQQDTA